MNKGFFRRKWKSLVISIVILLEVFAIAVVATHAWVETVSSIKITNVTNTVGTVSTYVYTDATIGSTTRTIDMADYFKQAGEMHFAPASSADGTTMYFPKANLASGFIYRKGNISDKNTAYLSATFRVKTDVNADFFFDNVPTFSALEDYIRVSVTTQSEGSTAAPVTEIFAKSASTAPVVNSTSGGTGATTVKAFSAHTKGSGSANRIFEVGANETKIVTINVWLQKRTDSNNDLTQNMSQAITVTNLGIISSLTPRHVTLLPTPTWDTGGKYFYAWCWDPNKSDSSELFKLELDENEHYSFDYTDGIYTKTLFIRSPKSDLTKATLSDNWNNTNYVSNQTVDTSIPIDPVDPTFIIETKTGGTGNKSTGSWHDPAKVSVAFVTGQDGDWGTLSAKSFVGTSTTSNVIEATNIDSTKHKDTVHAWPGKILELKATAKSNYAFVGWYDNIAGTGNALSTNATYTPNAPSTASEKVYYAKFKEVRSLTINRLVDGNASSTAAAGTITIGGSSSTNTATSYSRTFDKGSSVAFSGTALAGYTLQGIYTTNDDPSTATPASSPVTLNSNTTYYARFTTNSYNVTANAVYSTDGGSTYTAGNTGGTVEVGSNGPGATAVESVKYNGKVQLTATAAQGYYFDGWYTAATGGSSISSNSSYEYTLSTADNVNVYARFIADTWEIGYGPHGGTWNYEPMTVSGNTVTGSLTLTEGQNFSFKIRNTKGNTTTWYGKDSASYENITSTTFISNVTLSSSGADIYMKGHAGTYTFTFNKSSKVLNVSVVYSDITITFQYSSSIDVGKDGATISYYDGSGEINMTKDSTNHKATVTIKSNRGNSGSIGFNRWKDSGHSEHWDNWNAGDRGYSTTYTVSGWGSGSW